MIDKNYKVLSVKNLHKHFKVGSGKRKIVVRAVDDISFDIYKGEVYGLVGESGCGKTTTGRTIIRLYNATDGIVEFTTGEGEDKKTIVIGAGYETQIQEIRKAKYHYRFNKMKCKKYLSDKNEINVGYQRDKQENKINFEKTKVEIEEANKEIYLPYQQLKEKLFKIKNRYILKKEDIIFDGLSEVLKEKRNFEENTVKTLKYRLNFLRENYLSKKSGLKDSAAIMKSQRLLEIEKLQEQYIVQKADLKKQIKEVKLQQDSGKEEKREFKHFNKQVKVKVKAQIKELKQVYKKDINDTHQQFYSENHNEKTTHIFFVKLVNYFTNVKLFFKRDEKRNELKKKCFKLRFNNISMWFKHAILRIKLFFVRIFKPKDFKVDKEQLMKYKEELAEVVKAKKAEIKLLKEQNQVKNMGNTMDKIQMIFQDPIESLNPRMTVREIVSEGLVVRKVKDKKIIDEKVSNMLELVGLSQDYLYRYPHEFSGGQRQRIGIARALITNPELIIADEPVSALDVSIQAQVINLLNELKEKLGLTILFIAHDLSVVKYFCDRIGVMYYGKIVESTSSEELFENPLHPYTKALLSAIPQPDPILEKDRERSIYNPMVHNYRESLPKMVEIKPLHFIYGNDEEIEAYNKELGGKKK